RRASQVFRRNSRSSSQTWRTGVSLQARETQWTISSSDLLGRCNGPKQNAVLLRLRSDQQRRPWGTTRGKGPRSYPWRQCKTGGAYLGCLGVAEARASGAKG